MKVLVIGGGGREHAIAHSLTRSPEVKKIFVAPGNGGTAGMLENVPIKATDLEALRDFAIREGIDLTVVGPEDPLTLGIADFFAEKKLRVFGPSSRAAVIEGSKVFAREFLERIGVPQPRFRVFNDARQAAGFIESGKESFPLVIKADGLAAGKGVIIANDKNEAVDAVNRIMVDKTFGDAGRSILIEECLRGKEVSFFIITDGVDLIPFQTAQDYKRVSDGDAGPNTGGMGCYSPSVFLSSKQTEFIIEKIMRPTVLGMAAEGRKYKGFLYGGLMMTEDGIKVLEFNCRMGDPEAEVLFPRIESDLIPYLLSVTEERLGAMKELVWKKESAVTVILASGGYPGKPDTGYEINGIDTAGRDENVMVFHSGTTLKNGKIINTGGRVLAVTALGGDIAKARSRVYEAVSHISFDGMHYRTDIAADAVS
jgi:phosphoribosylamine--glycine ligase